MSELSAKDYNPAKAPFSWEKLNGLLAVKMSLVVCAEMLGCHENSIKNHIKQRHGLTFTEYAERKLSPTKHRLVHKAIEMATSGDRVMLIFCLKNLCKWSDNPDQELDSNIQIVVKGKSDKANYTD